MSLRKEEKKNIRVVLWEKERKGDVLRAGGPQGSEPAGSIWAQTWDVSEGVIRSQCSFCWGRGWPGPSGERPGPRLGHMGHCAV